MPSKTNDTSVQPAESHHEDTIRARPDELYELHARICKAIADPKRLCILNELRDGPRSVGEIASALGFSQPNTSQHLAILRSRGILTSSRSGPTIYYALRTTKVIEAVDLLREFMAEVLGGGDNLDAGVLEARAGR
ncbi:MAG: winged helix-turn-helix transcriptional regulator [Actinobacteria bacterium]|nr:winged helix-turn-helix transcriptional regulator [Actinomycetota bacterium]